MLSQQGRFRTGKARQYLQQLCKHFAHKVDARHSETEGFAALPPGDATMAADPTCLCVTVTAKDADGLRTARFIIDDHMVRFAHREAFEEMEWDTPRPLQADVCSPN